MTARLRGADTGFDRESHLVLACQEVANLSGCYLELICQRGGKRSGTTAGAPDGLLYRRGECLPVEFKARDGRLSRIQQITRACRDACGVPTHVIRTLQDFADLCGGKKR